MRIKVRITIILLAIVIPLFASDNDKKISESVTDAENDVHPAEKKHEPLISVEEINVTKLESIGTDRIEATKAKDDLSDLNGDSTMKRDRTNATEAGGRMANAGGIHAEETLEDAASSTPQMLHDDKNIDYEKVEEGMREHMLDSSFESKSDQTTIQNETTFDNSTDTESSPNATADLNHFKKGNTPESRQIDCDSANMGAKIDDTTVPVDKDESKGGEATVLDEDDFKLRGRVAVDYASKSAGALVIEKSGSFKGTSNLLNGDRDKYAIAPCEEKKFVVVSLSEDILVKEIKLANYERFSSTVNEFQIMGSQTMDTWVDLGTYGAEPGNGEQKFELIEPAWARYLKFKFLSHHGVEYYCTYSQIKVHGSTMVQGFHEQWEESEEPPDVVDDETRRFASTEETHLHDDTLIVAKSDDQPTKNEKRLNQNRTHPPSAAEVPSVSELSMPMSLEYMLQGRLPSDDNTVIGYRMSDDLLKHLPRASRRALMERRTLVPLEAATSIGLNRVVRQNVAKQRSVQISTSKMSIDFKKTLSVLFDQSEMGLEKNLSYLLSPVKNGGQPDLRKATDLQKVQPFNMSEEDHLAEDKADNTETEKKTSDTDVLEDKENDLSKSGESNNAAGASSTPPQTSTTQSHIGSSEQHFELDASIAKILVGLPGADCLAKLDLADFKAKAHPKDHIGTGASNHVGSMEPIFKKLTDEIKSLQINLSTQEQFTKVSVACYQRVLLDLMSENEKTRRQHELRLSRLEEELHSSEAFAWRLLGSVASMMSVLYSFILAWGATLVECWFEIWSWVLLASFFTFGTGLKFLTQLWPPMKRFLSTFGPLYPGIVPPLVDHVDDLLQYCEKRLSSVYVPPLSGIALDVIKFATLQFLSAVLVYIIMTHLRANLTAANGITDMTKNGVRKTKSTLPVVSPEKDKM